MKKIVIVMLLCCLFVGCTKESYTTKKEIIEYVTSNLTFLEGISNNIVSASTSDEEIVAYVEKMLPKDSLVKDVTFYNDNDGIFLDFYCGGRGLSTNSIYTGFYFSTNNQPFAFEFNHYPLEEIEDDVFYWTNENKTHTFYAERITTNWFYYEMKYY